MRKDYLIGWAICFQNPIKNEMQFLYSNGGEDRCTNNQTGAKIFNNFLTVLNKMRDIKRKKEFREVDYNTVNICKIYSGYEIINLADDDYTLEIQKGAIKKLSEDEIYALGVEKLAVFAKIDDTSKTYLEEFYPNETRLK